MLKFKKQFVFLIVITAIFAGCFGFIDNVEAEYVSTSTVTSADLISESNVNSIDSFYYNATSIPSGTSLEFQFATSSNSGPWYNSSGSAGSWDTVSTTGGDTIDLSSLNWSANSFYYKMRMTSDGTSTPVLDNIKVNYTIDYSGLFTMDKTSGYIGIGTTSPSSLFTVGSSGNFQVNDTGQVTSGTWQGDLISSTYGGTGWDSSAVTGIPIINSGTWSSTSTINDSYISDTLTLSTSSSVAKGALINTGTLSFDWLDSEIENSLTIDANGSVQAEAIDQEGATTGQVLEWNGTNWQPATDDDTTYSAGNDLDLSGTTFSLEDDIDVDYVRATGASGLGLYDDASNGIFIEDGGNVGIGTNNPAKKLHVSGNIRASGGSPYLETYINETTGANLRTGGGGNTFFGFIGGSFSIRNTLGGDSQDDIFRVDNGASAHSLIINSSGNVGIGTTSPGSELSVSGGAAIGSSYSGEDISDGNTVIENSMAIGTTSFLGALHVSGGRSYFEADIELSENDVNFVDDWSVGTGGANALRFTQIGTGGAEAEIQGDGSDYTNVYLTLGDAVKLDSSSGDSYISSGNVGIGTTSPDSKLTIDGGNIEILGNNELYSYGSDTLGNRTYTENNYVTDAETFTYSIDALDQQIASIEGGESGLWLDQGSYIYSSNYNNFVITDSGSVGIGTTSPNYDLDVGGDINATNSLCIGGDCKTAWGDIAGTTYSAGNDLDLSGTTFNIESTLDHVSTINLDGTGSITGLDSIDATTENTLESALDHDDLTGFVANEHIDHSSVSISGGTGLTGGGDITSSRTLSHADTSSQASSDNSGNTFIQDISLDGYGHLTGLTTGSVQDNWVDESGDSMSGGLGIGYSQPASTDLHVDGSVGVGTTSPSSRLTVDGDLEATGTTTFNRVSYNWPGSTPQSGKILSTNDGSGTLSWVDSENMGGQWVDKDTYLHPFDYEGAQNIVIGDTTTSSAPVFLSHSGDSWINSGGKVGIGTNSPNSLLSVGSASGFQDNNSGQVTSGTWQGDLVSSTYGGTGWDSSAVTGIPIINSGTWSSTSTINDSYISDTLTLSTSSSVAKGALINTGTLSFDWLDSEIENSLTIDANGSVQAEAIDQEGATTGQVLEWNGTNWQPATDDDTTYSAGNDLDLSGTTFSLEDDIDVDYVRATGASGLGLYDDASNGIFIEDGGNVGIGTNNPAKKLHVSGNIRASGGSPYLETYINETTGANLRTGGGGNTFFGFIGGSFSIRNTLGGDSQDDIFRVDNGASAHSLIINSSGNVGIGTTSPGSELSVSGGAAIGSSYSGEDISDGNTVIENSMAIGTTSFLGALHVSGGRSYFEADIELSENDVNFVDDWSVGTGGANALRFTQIGTGGAEAEIQGDGSDYTNVYLTLGDAVKLDSSSGDSYISSGNVGIGTTSPDSKLTIDGGNIEILGNNELYSYGSATLGNRTYTENNYVTDAETFTYSIDALDQQIASIEGGESGLWLDQGSYIYSSNYNNFVITDSGSVGIGTTSPNYDLDVGGDINATNSLCIGGDCKTAWGDIAGTTYSAGNDLDLSGTTFNIESTLDHVSTINLDGTGSITGLDSIDATTENTLESALDHDDLTGFVANEHIDHSSVSISSGSGLTGGGDITSSRTLSVNDVETLDTSLTSGSVVFSNGSTLTEDNSNFYWDDTNNRLGIGTTNPSTALTVTGSATRGGLLDIGGGIRVGTTDSNDDDNIWFDDGTEYLRWDESESEFALSKPLNINSSSAATSTLSNLNGDIFIDPAGGNVNPGGDLEDALGSPSYNWSNIYVSTTTFNGVTYSWPSSDGTSSYALVTDGSEIGRAHV